MSENDQKSAQFPDCFYRVSVKGLCVHDGKILLVRESEQLSGQWELPGGGLDFGEGIREGLLREIEEEMRIDVTVVSQNPVYVWTNYFEKRRGLDWFYTVVLAYRIEFSSLDFTSTKECEEIGFFDADELQLLNLHCQSTPLRTMFNPADFQNEIL